ncbi:MAG: dUTP diphosphatase [Gemmatimonadetes bacterium]|nr:dUTP diphosphatase [Gemmatimonadota bacterium]
MSDIIFEPLHAGVEPPVRATSASAGHDLALCLTGGRVRVFVAGVAHEREVAADPAGDPAGATITLAAGEKALFPLGFKARLPVGYEAQVRPRSGTSLKTDLVIVNSPGTIDADYPDEWCVPVKNGGTAPLTVRHGERIAQMVIARYETLSFTRGTVARTTDRAGGFGSTGR